MLNRALLTVCFLSLGAGLVHAQTTLKAAALDQYVTVPNGWGGNLPFSVPSFDTAGFWNATTPTRFTVPADVNYVQIAAAVAFDHTCTACQIYIRKNDTISVAQSYGATADTGFGGARFSAFAPVVSVTAGDYFTVVTYQNTGTSVNVPLQFSITRLDYGSLGPPLMTALLKESVNVPGGWGGNLAFSGAAFDTAGFWNGASPDRLTVPAGVNYVRVSASVIFSFSCTVCQIYIRKNNTEPVAQSYGSTANTGFGSARFSAVSSVVAVTEGDYFTVATYHNTGGSVSAPVEFSVIALTGQDGSTSTVKTAATNQTTTVPDGWGGNLMFSGVTADTAGFWSAGSPDRLTVPVGVDYAQVSASIMFEHTCTVCQIYVMKNDVFVVAQSYGATANTGFGAARFTAIAPIVAVSPGDYFTVRTFQNTQSAVTMPVNWSILALPQASTQSCTFDVSPTTTTIDAANQLLSLSVTTQSTCLWHAPAAAGFLTRVSGSGIGSGDVVYRAGANLTGSTRPVQLTIAGQLVRISQLGVSGCTYGVSPATQTLTAASQNVQFSIITQWGCPWDVRGTTAFMALVGPGSGIGSGQVTYAASENTTGAARSVQLHIAGQMVNVSQSTTLACTYTVDPTTTTLDHASQSAYYAVATQAGCPWESSPSTAFVTRISSGSSAGPGGAQYLASANNTGETRSVQLSIAGETVIIWQTSGPPPECDFSINPDSITVPATGGRITATVTVAAGCAWSATTESQFVTVFNGSGNGNGAFDFIVGNNYSGSGDSNPHPAREADIRIANRALRITQMAYDPDDPGVSCTSVSISPEHIDFGADGGVGHIQVSAESSCNWTIQSLPSWLAVNPVSGQGSQTITLTVSQNTGSARGSVLALNDSFVTVLQDGPADLAELSATGFNTDPTFVHSAGQASCEWKFNSANRNNWLFRGIIIWDGSTQLARDWGFAPQFTLRVVANVPQRSYSRTIRCDAIDLAKRQTVGSLSLTVPGSLTDACTDGRTDVIAEYIDTNHPFRPTCSDFTQTVPGPSHHSFPAWNQDNDHSWAILRNTVVSNLYCIIQNHGQIPPMTSGYRNPLAQMRINPQAPHSRHTYGDAADISTPNAPDNNEWTALRTIAKGGACGNGCVEPRNLTPFHFHVDYRPPTTCPVGW